MAWMIYKIMMKNWRNITKRKNYQLLMQFFHNSKRFNMKGERGECESMETRPPVFKRTRLNLKIRLTRWLN